jgi:hypothetical protein
MEDYLTNFTYEDDYLNKINYNNLDKKIQLEILEKFYPIGGIFHHKQPNPSIPHSKLFYKDYFCKIISYKELETWFILEIENINLPGIRTKFEVIHPGFFRPSLKHIRKDKIKKILENE